MDALEEKIKESDPMSLSTYLMTQELVNVSQKLAMVYASPVIAKMEKSYHWYTTDTICYPILAQVVDMPTKEVKDQFMPRNMRRVRRNAEKIFTENRTICFTAALNSMNGISNNVPGACYDLYEGDEPMEISIRTLVRVLHTINNDIGIPEYSGLKQRIYDILEYLLRFKDVDTFMHRLQTQALVNITKSERKAPALVAFYKEFEKASPPFFHEIPKETWDNYLDAMTFYQDKKQETEFTGYQFGCAYGEFPVLFTDFEFLYKRRIPCDSPYSKKYGECVSCTDWNNPRTCSIQKN